MGSERSKTGAVPREMGAAFARAEEVVSRFFEGWRAQPEQGTIEIFGERYVLVRAASLSVEFFGLARELYGRGREQEADQFARNLLFDLAHAIGKSDAQTFHTKTDLADPVERISAGPVHFAYTGWASVVIHPESVLMADEDRFYLVYDHTPSFESDAWLRSGERRDFPVCIMNAGYSSGWCAGSFGLDLVSTEVLCRARGDDHCRFVMAHPTRIERALEAYFERRPAVHSPKSHYEIPDLFARKRVEEELRRSYAELEDRVKERTAELERSYERLQREIEERERVEEALRHAQKLDAVGRLAGGIAHDFNNLMGTVSLRAARLKARLGAEREAFEDLEEIEAATAHAAALTKQLLTFSRRSVSGREPCDLNRIVSGLARTLLPLLGEDVLLRLDLAEEGVVIEADRAQMEQLVMNLAVNAREAMPSGGHLTIRTARVALEEPRVGVAGEISPGDYALLEVCDEGVGMDPEMVSTIFEPFFSTKEASRGSGFGLSTVFGVAQQSQGQIEVRTRPDEGTAFSVYFPATERPAGPEEGRPESEPPLGGFERVLVVEDQSRVRAAVRDVLHEIGYSVVTASRPTEALARAEEAGAREEAGAGIDLLITDIVLPSMDGRELARRVQGFVPGLRVLYMSGYIPDSRHNATSGMDVSEVLKKPFSAEELASAVRRVLDREEESSGPQSP